MTVRLGQNESASLIFSSNFIYHDRGTRFIDTFQRILRKKNQYINIIKFCTGMDFVTVLHVLSKMTGVAKGHAKQFAGSVET